jgi:seryl-tRNA synthetase
MESNRGIEVGYRAGSALGQQAARQNSNSGGIAVGSSLNNEIPTEMVELRELVARLTLEVRELSARLNSVIEDGEYIASPTAKRETLRTPLTPLGRDLRDLTNQLYEVSEQVRRVTVSLGV